MDSSTRRILVGLGILLVLALALFSTMGGMMGPGMVGPYPGRFGGWMWGAGMWLGGLAMLVFWGALIVGAVVVLRLLGGGLGGGASSAPESPADILKRRYASGEIDREQYERMRKDLES